MKENGIKKLLDFIQFAIKRPAMFDITCANDVWLIWLGYQNAVRNYDHNSIQYFATFEDGFNLFVKKRINSVHHQWQNILSDRYGKGTESLKVLDQFLRDYMEEYHETTD